MALLTKSEAGPYRRVVGEVPIKRYMISRHMLCTPVFWVNRCIIKSRNISEARLSYTPSLCRVRCLLDSLHYVAFDPAIQFGSQQYQLIARTYAHSASHPLRAASPYCSLPLKLGHHETRCESWSSRRHRGRSMLTAM